MKLKINFSGSFTVSRDELSQLEFYDKAGNDVTIEDLEEIEHFTGDLHIGLWALMGAADYNPDTASFTTDLTK